MESPNASTGPPPPGAPPPRPLTALHGAADGPDLLPCRAADHVERWLIEGGGVLWLRGPAGSGRTTAAGAAVRRVLAREPASLSGAVRIEGWAATRFEEALFAIDQFLRQMGIGDLERVLHQRTPLTVKLSMLVEVLRRHPLLLWLDDFERLSAAGSGEPGRCARFFARIWSELRQAPGRLLVVTEGAGPDGLVPEETPAAVLTLDRTLAVDPGALWERLRARAPLAGEARVDGALLGGEPLPLAIRLRHAVLAAAGAGGGREVARRAIDAGCDRLVGAIVELLDPPARRALEAAAAFHAPLSRGALKTLARLEASEEEPAAAAIERSGLVEPPGEEGSAVRLHPSVRQAVERLAAKSDPGAWKELVKQAALHLLEAGNRTGDVTYLLRARERLHAGGHHSEAYEVQKLFLEELLRRGFHEIALKILEESAATTSGLPRAVSLGNLAIVHKNEGNLDEAARLYEEVRQEFQSVGDLSNTARVYHQLGNTHYLRGDHARAIDSYQKSLEISLETGDRAVAAATRVQLANVQYVQGRHQEALENYRETIGLALEIGDRNIAAAVRIQIGQLLVQLRRFAEAEEELRLAEKEAEALGDQRNRIKIEQLLGLLDGERRDYDPAVAHLQRALEIATGLRDALETVACCLRIGMLERERLQFSRAAAAFFSALDFLHAAVGLEGETPSDLTTYRSAAEEKIRELAHHVGREVFERIVRALGRKHPFPDEPPPAAPAVPPPAPPPPA